MDSKIRELKEWQRVAWRRIADRSVTPFERREIRNHIKESDEALRHYLRLMSKHLQREAQTVEDTGDSLANIRFRILAQHGDPR